MRKRKTSKGDYKENNDPNNAHIAKKSKNDFIEDKFNSISCFYASPNKNDDDKDLINKKRSTLKPYNLDQPKIHASIQLTQQSKTKQRNSSNSYETRINVTSSMTINEQITSDYNYQEEKPPYYFSQLVAQAISSSPKKKLTISQIYAYISSKFKYYRLEDKAWKKSLTRCLCNGNFLKVTRQKNEPFWRIEPTKERHVINEAFSIKIIPKKYDQRNTMVLRSSNNSLQLEKSRIDFVEEKLGSLSETIKSRISSIDNHFQALQTTNQTDLAPLSLNYTTQDITKDEQNLNNFTTIRSIGKDDEFYKLLLLSKQLCYYSKNNENLLNISSSPISCLSFFDLIQIGDLFENGMLSNKLKEFVLENLKFGSLKSLLEDIMKNYTDLNSSLLVSELIEYRIQWIKDYFIDRPKFCWKMPNPVFADGQSELSIIDVVREFLQSENEYKAYTCGVSLNFARKIVNDFFWASKKSPNECALYEQNGYSMNMEAVGSGQNAQVIMTKTRVYFDNCLLEYEKNCKELKNELENLKKFQIEFKNLISINEISHPISYTVINQNDADCQEQSFLEANISLLTNRCEMFISILELFERIDKDTDNVTGNGDAYSGFYNYD